MRFSWIVRFVWSFTNSFHSHYQVKTEMFSNRLSVGNRVQCLYFRFEIRFCQHFYLTPSPTSRQWLSVSETASQSAKFIAYLEVQVSKYVFFPGPSPVSPLITKKTRKLRTHSAGYSVQCKCVTIFPVAANASSRGPASRLGAAVGTACHLSDS